MGQKVEAQYKGKDKFYPGVISRCRINGTYDIDYDDGEKETTVSADLIKALSTKKPAADTSEDERRPVKKFKEGDKIEAQYKGKSKFYPGVISRCRLNGTYDIDYDDGEKETGVAAELIRAKGASSPVRTKSDDISEDGRKPARKLREGDKVEAQYKGKSKFYPGVISRCRLNGTYDIDYDDGEKETGVTTELIRLKGDDEPKAKKSGFKEGEKVEAQYKGKSKFYPGVISRCRLNGTYDIDYDDGEKETGVVAELIRLKGGSSPVKKSDDTSEGDRKPARKLKEGDKVEAQYKGKSKFYPGVISRCRLNGTYDIDYDDGEKETGVAVELIRLKGGSSPVKKKSDDTSEDDRKLAKKFREGEKVEAQYKGKSKFYPGVISRCRLNGTYDIDYDDGEKETGVAAELIRSLSKTAMRVDDSDDDRKSAKKFREGEKVEAQYKGKSKFYPGIISRCRLNGTYDIEYDDGEKETGVAAELIRSKELSSPKKKADDSSEDDRRTKKKFKEGEKVEAQYKGKSKFYPGVISRCRLNGTYDIDYDDGEKEAGVAAELICSKEPTSPSRKKTSDTSDDERKPSAKKFKEREKVEAQYKGKSKFYSGVIARCRLNGTYDIDYDDGEKETGVVAELIRSLEKKSNDTSGEDRKEKRKFKEGEKVEAQYKGKSKFYPGVISRCRLNGTYDIDYDDGEKETGVAAELIHSCEASDSGGKCDPKKFKEGEKVEAQYKGKSKFYPGVISRCRLNGTYDIDYDDGEKETGVAAELIRAKGASSPVRTKSDDISEDGRKPARKLREGDKVEAQYKGKSKFYPGVISRCRLNGTYDIDYDDGEKETGVTTELIRLKGDDEPKAKKSGFKEGEKVEAQYKGKSKFYPGVISRCRLNGTYDIDYDDGEKETGVVAELIRLKGGSSPVKKSDDTSEGDRKPARKLKEGDKVEAQYKGKSKFYPGVISRCRLNGTYDIDYDDGEKETGVAVELIRLKGGSSPVKKKSDDTSEDDRKLAKKFREGEKVEAQYKGKSKFYPGVISRCRLNGTYDIDYDDGEKETGVAAELIRSLSKTAMRVDDRDFSRPASIGKDSGQSYRVGARIEALYMGKDKYFKGTISCAHSDRTYDIEYDDGDKENKVPSKSIRLLKSASNFSAAQFSVEKPTRPNPAGGARRRSGNSSD
uniref:Tudor domain-containing protein n=1 Tax=Globisporangium ultimum (strain ATCC 200006 / CBS 805.95 / DAOM BR144) TaxID=431595 RepID=K3WN12_GLOUD